MKATQDKKSGGLWGIVRSALLIAFAVGVVVYLFQRRLQYFPDSSEVPLPNTSRFDGLEEMELMTSDGVRVLGWYWPGRRDLTVVLFHGNAGHRGHRLEWMAEFHGRGFGVFLLDYRGYGGSGGSPTEEGFYLDATAAVEWLQERGAGELVYLGESIGCGVAVEMALRKPPAMVILQSGYSSVVDIAREVYPFLPVSLLMRDRFECQEKIGKMTCPLLMIHGEQDSIIPVRIGRALFDAAPEPKEWLLIPGAHHNDSLWLMAKDYFERIEALLPKQD